MTRWFLALMFSLVALPVTAQPVRLFIVDPALGGFVDDRAKSAKDLANYFRMATDPKAKKDQVALVLVREDADLIVEILERGVVNTGGLQSSAILGGGLDAKQTLRVTAKMTAGDYTTTFSGDGGITMPMWREAAGAIAAQIKKFAKENRAKLQAARH